MVVLSRTKTNPLKLDPLVPKAYLTRGPKRQRISERRTDRVVALYAGGMSTRKVAAETGLSKTAVMRVLKTRGVKMRPRGGHN